jgi:hypothetical protein
MLGVAPGLLGGRAVARRVPDAGRYLYVEDADPDGKLLRIGSFIDERG